MIPITRSDKIHIECPKCGEESSYTKYYFNIGKSEDFTTDPHRVIVYASGKKAYLEDDDMEAISYHTENHDLGKSSRKQTQHTHTGLFILCTVGITAAIMGLFYLLHSVKHLI